MIQQQLQLAQQHLQQGQSPLAKKICQGILLKQPHHPEALFLLGVSFQQEGQGELAMTNFKKAIQYAPKLIPAHFSLGCLYEGLQKFAEAEQSFKQILDIQPQSIESREKMALMLIFQGKIQEAVVILEKGIQLSPHFALYYQLGNAYFQSQELEQALHFYQKALELNPQFVDAAFNMGVILQDQQKFSDSIEYYEKVQTFNPQHIPSLTNMGAAYKRLGKLVKAETCLKKVLALNPGAVKAYQNLAGVVIRQGKHLEAVEYCERALKLQPKYPLAHSSLVFYYSMLPSKTQDDILDCAKKWGASYAAPLLPTQLDFQQEKNPDKVLKVGFFSPDFLSGAVATFTMGLFTHYNREKFQFFCYSDSTRTDGVTHQIQSLIDGWRNIHGLSDEQVAQMVREDNMDILIDLAGHTAGGRLLTFARKPAPVLMTFYASTTGVKAIDYRITDRYFDPPDTTWNVERPLRMPHSLLCYSPPVNCPDVQPITPAIENGYMTFGSFNNPLKLNQTVIAFWAKILKQFPTSRLILKYLDFIDPDIQTFYLSLFEKEGIESSRIELVAFTDSFQAHLEYYHKIDLALDPFPFNGMTTTCEALWMGVPVIVLEGSTHFGRAGVSILSTLGLKQLIASTQNDYLKILTDFAEKPETMNQLRQEIRALMMASPLCDSIQYVRSWESSFRNAWKSWCSSVGGA